jgi:hypothetical protein
MAGRPPEVERLVHEAHSNDPYIASNARTALSAMGRKGGKIAGKKKRARREAKKQVELELKLAEQRRAYLEASRGS